MMTPSFLRSVTFKLTAASYMTLILTLTGCQSLTMTKPATTSAITNPVNSVAQSYNASVIKQSESSQQTLKQHAWHIQHALAKQNYASIIDDIHPTRGVRFSMYAYVLPESDKVFSREQFAQYLHESKIRFTWGDLDGTGELLIMPLPQYLNTWVNSSKFNHARIRINESKHNGNMINNVKDIYQNSEVAEFYYKGTDEYVGMDWRVMRLVFDDYQGQRYLVAIINDQWTV